MADVDIESGEEEQGDYATFVPKRRLVPISESKDEGSSSKFRREQSRTKGSILKQSSRASDSRTHATMTADARASRNQQSSHGHLGGLGPRERSKFGRGGSSGVERRTERYDYKKPYQQASTIYRHERSWQEKFTESAHKRNDAIRRNADLQNKVIELEHEVERLKRRFKELMMKKASGIMREEYNELERKHNECVKELERCQAKEEEVATQVEAVKMRMKKRQGDVVKALQEERSVL